MKPTASTAENVRAKGSIRDVTSFRSPTPVDGVSYSTNIVYATCGCSVCGTRERL